MCDDCYPFWLNNKHSVSKREKKIVFSILNGHLQFLKRQINCVKFVCTYVVPVILAKIIHETPTAKASLPKDA